MKRLFLVYCLMLLLFSTVALAEISEDKATATGYVVLEIKEPPKLAPANNLAAGTGAYSAIKNKSIFAENSALIISALFILAVLTAFNAYKYIEYANKQKAII